MARKLHLFQPALGSILKTNLGRLQLSLGKPELALANWQKATNISEQQLGDRPERIRNQIYQAEALQQLGLYNQACVMLLLKLG